MHVISIQICDQLIVHQMLFSRQNKQIKLQYCTRNRSVRVGVSGFSVTVLIKRRGRCTYFDLERIIPQVNLLHEAVEGKPHHHHQFVFSMHAFSLRCPQKYTKKLSPLPLRQPPLILDFFLNKE
jgi:hypothetical protein